MSAQTSYNIAQAIAYAGGIYAQAPHDIISRAVETAAGIAFGVAVSRGTDKDAQAVVGGSDLLGIVIRSLDKEGAANTGAIQWNELEQAGILRSGYVWAKCVAGCVPGNAVNYNTTTGVLDAGAPGAGEAAVPNASWESTASANGLAVLRIGA